MPTSPAASLDTAVDALLSAPLHLDPVLRQGRLFWIANPEGFLSLYARDLPDGPTRRLLPDGLALRHPGLVDGRSYVPLPEIASVLVMIDRDGDERAEPALVPWHGGAPEPLLPGVFRDEITVLCWAHPASDTLFFDAAGVAEPRFRLVRASVATREVHVVYDGPEFTRVADAAPDGSRALVLQEIGAGDDVLYCWDAPSGTLRPLLGIPREERASRPAIEQVRVSRARWVSGRVLALTSLFDDAGGLVWVDPEGPAAVRPVGLRGDVPDGTGELEDFDPLGGDRLVLRWNLDGISHAREATFDPVEAAATVGRGLGGEGSLAGGVLTALSHDPASDTFVGAFSSATATPRLFSIEPGAPAPRLLAGGDPVPGLPEDLLCPGEDASFESFDGLRVSARLYRPSPRLGLPGPRPVVFYIHGGPQWQERPDFTWFSVPLIQLLALQGIAVFVPNARGSTGYGRRYADHVRRDWGGADRLDHVHARAVLARDPGLDLARAGVMGRSYGGYMTLTLVARHPELWRAACDMFGPADLPRWSSRLPEAHKPWVYQEVGHPEHDRDLLVERSPTTWLSQVRCPLLVIQGRNDPRVVESESRALVEQLRAAGGEVEYLVFDDEGHDVLRRGNRATCYVRIAGFFVRHLEPGRPAR